MLTIKRLKVLVCQIILVCVATTVTWGYTGPDISGPGVQGDALSADPTYQNRSVPKQQTYPAQPQTGSSYTSRGHKGSVRSNPSYPAYRGNAPMVSPTPPICGPQGCPVPGVAAGNPVPVPAPGMFGLFSQQGMGFGPCGGAFLPHVGAKQFQVSAQVWYPTLYRSDVIWGTNGAFGAGTQLDLKDDLDLGPNQYLGVYEGRCQIKCNWGLRFTFMPINYRANTMPRNFFYFGNTTFSANINTLTIWDRYVYRAELVYDWFHRPNAVSSLFAGYVMYDDKLTISQPNFSRSRSRTQGLYTAGASIERLIRDIGSATVSTECRGSVNFDNDHFGWDGVWLGRVYMPMNCGRYGYLEGGYRWYVMETSQPTDYDKINLAGPTAGIGLIF
ncbi:MAG: hypothetical protein WC647_02185 [Desulfomonilaceae bacterium]|jgi:hypothetical protein